MTQVVAASTNTQYVIFEQALLGVREHSKTTAA